MTKDYAKRRRMIAISKTKARHSPPVRSLSLWKWMSVILLLGVCLSVYLYWKNPIFRPKTEYIQVQKKDLAPKVKVKTSHTTALNNKVSKIAKETSARFDFYKVLPNMTAEILEDATPSAPILIQTAQAKPLSEMKAAPSQEIKSLPSQRYLLQAGSFKYLKQAEELKAKLALSGFEARIQTVKIADTQTWYRVNIGPFDAKDKAETSRQKLEQAHTLHSLVLKMQV